MAVTYVGERFWSREGEETSLVGDNVSTRLTRTFFLTASATTDTYLDVLHNVNIPELGDSSPTNFSAKCTRRRARNLPTHWKHWEVDCEYESVNLPEVEYRYSFERSEVVVDGGWASTPNNSPPLKIASSAGELFDPPQTMPKFRPLITVIDVVDVFDPAESARLIGAVNDNAFSINGQLFFVRQAMIVAYDATQEIIGGQQRWRRVRQYLIENDLFKQNEHKLRLLDFGSYCWESENDKAQGAAELQHCVDKHGNPIKGRLDGQGFQIFDNNAPDVFRVWYIYRQETFEDA